MTNSPRRKKKWNHPKKKTQISPAAASVTETLEETLPRTVSGSLRLDYILHYISGSSSYDGTYTCNGITKDVSFVPLGEAEGNQIFDASASKRIFDEGVITPNFITYSEDISENIICYQRFDCSLKDWLTKWRSSKCVKDSNGLLHPEIRKQISKLLKSVSNIHDTGLLHLSLSDISNYVVINGNWSIINISGTLDKSNSKWKSETVSDFHGFRDMLKNNVLSDPSWQESNDFLNTFDMPNDSPARFVRTLLNHVFFKCSRERLGEELQSTVHWLIMNLDVKELGDIFVSASGSFNSEYKLNHVSGSSYYNGTLASNGKTKHVSFVPFRKAKGNEIFDTSKRIFDKGVITPNFITYCKDISENIICYHQFDCSLKEWLTKWCSSNCVKDSNGLLNPEIRKQISKLLKSLRNIHKKGLLHLSLSDISNYVVIDEDWYIINISGTLDKSDSKWKSEIISDFRGFRDMLKRYVLSDPSWQESKDFLDTFDMPNDHPARLVQILLNHVFFKCSHERLQMFSVIHHGLMDPSPKGNMLRNAIKNGYFKGYTDRGWNKDRDKMGDVLSKIYKYQNNYDVSIPTDDKYNGYNIFSLLKFLRNVYEHYKEHNGDVVAIEKEVREFWPGLLGKLLHYC